MCWASFKGLARLGQTAYCLELPHNMQQVTMCYLSLSSNSTGVSGRTQPPPPPDLVDDCPEWTVEQVLDHTTVYRGRQRKILSPGLVMVMSITHGKPQRMSPMLLYVQDYWLTPPANCRLATWNLGILLFYSCSRISLICLEKSNKKIFQIKSNVIPYNLYSYYLFYLTLLGSSDVCILSCHEALLTQLGHPSN